MRNPLKRPFLPAKPIQAFANDLDFLSYVNPYRKNLLALAREKVATEPEAERLVMRALLSACAKRYQLKQRTEIFTWLKTILQAQAF